MHKLFQKQLEKSRLPSGEIDIDALGALVSAAYEESERDRRRTERSIALMVEELDQLNGNLEKEVERRTAQLRESRAELELQNARFDAALTHMTHGLTMFDSQARLVLSNRRWRQMYSLPEEFATPGRPFLDIVTRLAESGTLSEGFDEPKAYVEHVLERVKSGKPSYRLLDLADGRTFTATWQPTSDGGWVSIHEDVTERRRAEQRIAHMARHDTLTNLPNRVLLLDRLRAGLDKITAGNQVAVHYLDLDRFKTINDTLGHPLGDTLLMAVAHRLQRCVKERDTVARIGGDEFAIVQTGITGRADAAILAKRICQTMNGPYDLNGHLVVADATVGIAVAPDDGMDPNELLKNADLALHRAKVDGRGSFRFFEPEMDARMKARRELEVDLRKAYENEQFQLHFQPIVDLRSNTVSSCEALLRWPHSERGLISPAEFVSVAEEIGLISQLGEWVLRNACKTAATWPESIGISVNVSPTQLTNGNLVPIVENALLSNGLAPNRLVIEITEEVLVRNPDIAQRTLRKLREVGVRIALDDFGTGYSSLIYLCRFPFDKIKIDRSFIKDLPNREPAAIISAITGLARSLDMIATAEGVETPNQLKQVRALGCTEIQGYIIGKPKTASAIAEFLAPAPTPAVRAGAA